MELMQLEMFVAVVEEGSVHRAADKVCRTQPAVSIALKKLGIEVGSPLFHRKHRFDYQLTPTGEILYSYATRLLCLRNEAVAALRELANLSRGAVTAASPGQVTALLTLEERALCVTDKNYRVRVLNR